jgi:hypothetical protein
MFTVEQASRFYGVPLIDYERPGSGLLVSSGSGIMMATMDAVPALRWCVDIDGLGRGARLAEFLQLAEHVADPIGICGWFSITDPTVLREAVRSMTRAPLVYAGNIVLGAGAEVRSLDDFVRALRERAEGALSRTG